MPASSTLRRVAALVAIAGVVASCSQKRERALDNRLWSDTYAFRISVEPTPPRAIEDAVYKIVVQDKKTGEPIESGQGRIFASSRDGASTDDGLAKGKEVGTYYGRLFFPTTGDWAIALQFRRDSTQRLERVDWLQGVREATGQ